MKTVNRDLTKVLSSRYAKKWVALNPQQTRVIASGNSPVKVLAAAKKQRISKPVITLAWEDYRTLVS